MLVRQDSLGAGLTANRDIALLMQLVGWYTLHAECCNQQSKAQHGTAQHITSRHGTAEDGTGKHAASQT